MKRHRKMKLLISLLSALLVLSCQGPGSTPPPASTNANLASILLSDGTLSPVFSADTTIYSVFVENGIDEITITATPSHASATVMMSAGMPLQLTVGVNPLTINVTAEDGITSKSCVLSINRDGPENADLAALTVSSGSLVPSFSSGTTAYTVIVPYSTTTITVTGTASSPSATLSANNGVPQALSVGTNVIPITVTAPDGTTTREYTVTATRASPSSNANLQTLTIMDSTGATLSLSPSFSASVTSYTASTLDYADELYITATRQDAQSSLTYPDGQTVSARGLAAENVDLRVTVTAEAGNQKTYTVTVDPKPAVDTKRNGTWENNYGERRLVLNNGTGTSFGYDDISSTWVEDVSFSYTIKEDLIIFYTSGYIYDVYFDLFIDGVFYSNSLKRISGESSGLSGTWVSCHLPNDSYDRYVFTATTFEGACFNADGTQIPDTPISGTYTYTLNEITLMYEEDGEPITETGEYALLQSGKYLNLGERYTKL